MVREIQTMELFTKTERHKYCPFFSCLDNCPLVGEKCEIENILKSDHKTHYIKYEAYPSF